MGYNIEIGNFILNTFIIGTIFAFCCAAIFDHINDKRLKLEFQAYLNTICVGDIFEWEAKSNDNPFDPQRRFVITDIRVNKSGKKFVEYYFYDVDKNILSNKRTMSLNDFVSGKVKI
jgi:hypothetical protein